jgi:polyferredoxin
MPPQTQNKAKVCPEKKECTRTQVQVLPLSEMQMEEKCVRRVCVQKQTSKILLGN